MHWNVGATTMTLAAIDKIDIYRSAQLLIDQHGDEAAIHAAMRADESLAAGDLEGAATRPRIIRAIENEILLRFVPSHCPQTQRSRTL